MNNWVSTTEQFRNVQNPLLIFNIEALLKYKMQRSTQIISVLFNEYCEHTHVTSTQMKKQDRPTSSRPLPTPFQSFN